MPFINVILNDSEESESIHQVLADSSLCSNPTVTTVGSNNYTFILCLKKYNPQNEAFRLSITNRIIS